MENDWVRENIETEQVTALPPVECTVETEAALPGGLREEARVLHADALAAVNGGEWAGSRVTADGRVTFHVLYVQGDMERVRALEAAADFAQTLPGAESDAGRGAVRVRPRAEVLAVSAKAFNGRMLMRAVLRLSADAVARKTVACIAAAEDAPSVQQSFQTLTLERTVGEGEGQTLLREEFELSDVLQITDTLYAAAHARVEDILGGADGRATVAGTLLIEAWHASDMPGRPLVNTRHTAPFEQTVSLSGALGDALAARSEVRDVAVLSQENDDGSRVMRAEVQLFTEISAVASEEKTLLRDAFTTAGDGVEITAERETFRSGTVNEQTDAPFRAVMVLEEGAPRVKTALAGFVRPVMTESRGTDGQLTAEGVAELTLVYLPEEGSAPLSVTQETPFRAAFAASALPEDRLSLAAGEAEVSAQTGERVEFRCQLRLTAEGVRRDSAEVVTRAAFAPAPETEKGISLYYLQPGETAWDIAKRYRASLDEIRELNPALPENAAPGTPVIVYTR